jgi:hypothetical protein
MEQAMLINLLSNSTLSWLLTCQLLARDSTQKIYTIYEDSGDPIRFLVVSSMRTMRWKRDESVTQSSAVREHIAMPHILGEIGPSNNFQH